EIPELRRKHRADERPRAGDRGEVMAEKDPLIRGKIIMAVVKPMRRGHPGIVQDAHSSREKRAVVAICQGQDTENQNHDGKCGHGGIIGDSETTRHRGFSEMTKNDVIESKRPMIEKHISHIDMW